MCPVLEMQMKEKVMKCFLHSGWETKKLRKQFIGNRQVMEKRWLSFFVMIIYALGYRNPPDHSKISA
jgi:hypothetical protein